LTRFTLPLSRRLLTVAGSTSVALISAVSSSTCQHQQQKQSHIQQLAVTTVTTLYIIVCPMQFMALDRYKIRSSSNWKCRSHIWQRRV